MYFIDVDQTFSTGLFNYNLLNGLEIDIKLSVINLFNKKGEGAPYYQFVEISKLNLPKIAQERKKKPLIKQDLNLPLISASVFSIF